MNWIMLNELNQLTTLRDQSNNKAILIFKHSTRCSISRTALDRLERSWKPEEMTHITPYFLDLISHREISNQVAGQFGIEHESPQVLIIKNGEVVYDRSHFDIDYTSLRKAI
jgi:bacillithiol system protein YtxJ